MRPRWRVELRFLCILLTMMVAMAVIPSVTDTVVAQGTGTPEVCQRIASIMPRLLQTADRLRKEQDQYQKDLDNEYLELQDAGAAVTNAGFTTANQNVRNLIVNIFRQLLKMIQQTRADMRKVAQQQAEIGRQIFHLRDVAASAQCTAPTATKPVGPSGPPSGGGGAAYDCNPSASITFTVGSRTAKSVNCGNTYLPTTYTAFDQMQHVPIGTRLPILAQLSGPLAQGWVITVASSRKEWCRETSGSRCETSTTLNALPDSRYGSAENFFVQVHAPNGNVAGQVQITMVWCNPQIPLVLENYKGTCG
jgi:hypothetical protein